MKGGIQRTMARKKKPEKIEFEEEDDEEDFEDDEEDLEEEEEKELPKMPTPPRRGRPAKSKEDDLAWESVQQVEFSGFRNRDTQEIIDHNEAIRRILSYAEEAAKNTR